jgi:hypothetical protein
MEVEGNARVPTDEGVMFSSLISAYPCSSASSPSSVSPPPFNVSPFDAEAGGSSISSSWQYMENRSVRWMAWSVIEGYSIWKLRPVVEAKIR